MRSKPQFSNSFKNIRRLFSAVCWLFLGTWLLPAFVEPAEEAQKNCKEPGSQRKGNATARRPMTLSEIGSSLRR
jgi:hypothetical protein